MTPNEARNLALQFVDTEYVAFVDDNAFVRPGWLDALVRCADETGASIVGPLIGFRIGAGRRETVHVFGGENHVTETGVSRRHIDRDFNGGLPLEEAAATLAVPGVRWPSSIAFSSERSSSRSSVPSTRACGRRVSTWISACSLATSAERSGSSRRRWSSTSSRSRIPLADRPFYVLRWSDEWNRASVARFAEKWRLTEDDPSSEDMIHWAADYRRIAYRLSPKLLDRAVNKVAPGLKARVDSHAQRMITARTSAAAPRAEVRGWYTPRAGTSRPPTPR